MTASKQRLNDMGVTHPVMGHPVDGHTGSHRHGTPQTCHRQAGLTAGSTALMLILLAGCSSVPDAVNPVEWYRGATEAVTGRSTSKEAREAAARKIEERDYPDNRVIPERPRVLSPEDRKDIADGLVADRANAKYTQERINRDGNPTRPLTAKPAQAGGATSPAQAGGSTSAPVEAGPTAPAPSPEPAAVEPPRTRLAPADQQSEAPQAPSVPPQQVAHAPAAEAMPPVSAPAPIPIPPPTAAAVPVTAPQPVAARQSSAVDDAFRRRLAQSAPATTSATMADTAVVTPASLATPSLTQVAVDFSPGRTHLSDDAADDLEDLADAARRSGSRIRVVANALPTANTAKAMSQALALAIRRADVVALELRRSGVPADHIDVSTGTDGDRVDAGLF